MTNPAPGASGAVRIDLDARSYSNAAKRLAAHLSERHNAQLSHTQARTALARSLGFESPNVVDAQLRSGPTRSPEAVAESSRASDAVDLQSRWRELTAQKNVQDAESRTTRIELLRQCLEGPITANKRALVFDLINLQLALLHDDFAAQLSAKDLKSVQQMYPEATGELASERALNQQGVSAALNLATTLARIPIDYLPQSNTSAAFKKDDKRPEVGRDLTEEGDALFRSGVDRGFSEIGTAAIMVSAACANAVESGVHWTGVARLLLEMLDFVQRLPASHLEFQKERAREVAKMAGISERTALKYVSTDSSRV